MRLTRDHLSNAFPTLGALARNAPDIAFGKLLASELGAFTDNLPYACDIAMVLMSHVNNTLYTDLPDHLVNYRATVDTFFLAMEESRASLYIRSIGLALKHKRTPARFKKALCARANEYRLVVPRQLFDDFADDRFSTPVKVRLPKPVVSDIKTRALSKGITISDYLREAIYERIHREDKER